MTCMRKKDFEIPKFVDKLKSTNTPFNTQRS